LDLREISLLPSSPREECFCVFFGTSERENIKKSEQRERKLFKAAKLISVAASRDGAKIVPLSTVDASALDRISENANWDASVEGRRINHPKVRTFQMRISFNCASTMFTRRVDLMENKFDFELRTAAEGSADHLSFAPLPRRFNIFRLFIDLP
jgi:hypothetical protein